MERAPSTARAAARMPLILAREMTPRAFARSTTRASRHGRARVRATVAGVDSVRTLIIGAGVTGLATAGALDDDDYLVLEGDSEIGGYCKTIKTQGFVWDYSGHFFHFKHPEIEAQLRERMPGQRIRTVQKKSFIAYKGRWIDFPFQKNIHQLPKDEFIDCLYDLYFARAPGMEPKPENNFEQMLHARFGKSICDKFLVPYNEKVYACDLSTLDKDAMGRFFPHADLTAIIRNMKEPDNASYNATFTYPEGGAIEYIKALATEVDPAKICTSEKLIAIDLKKKTAKTSKREIRFQHMVSSAPFNQLARMSGIEHDLSVFSWNKVLVFNLGFDKKGPKDVHWIYYPDRARSFYRVGFYDNIFDSDRLSIYVELGFARDADVRAEDWLDRVLADLREEGVISNHRLVAHHSVVMDPAYVHITKKSIAEHARVAEILRAHGVRSAGRYGRWTYCSIEDNIVEARALAKELA
jgi:protoporphyrinogen oxidase